MFSLRLITFSDPSSNISVSFLFLIPWELLRLSHDSQHKKLYFIIFFCSFFKNLAGVGILESSYISTFLSHFSVICFFYTSLELDHWAQISVIITSFSSFFSLLNHLSNFYFNGSIFIL